MQKMKVVGKIEVKKWVVKYYCLEYGDFAPTEFIGTKDECINFVLNNWELVYISFIGEKLFYEDILEPIDSILHHQWVVCRDLDCQSGQYVWVFDPKANDAQINEFLEKKGVEVEGISIHSAYDCTGKMFSHPVRINRGKSRTFVTQFWGIDV